VGCPKRMRDCKVMIANSPMDTDKVKIYGSKVKVDSVSKVAEIEAAEKKKMLDKVDKILAHGCNVFINRCSCSTERAGGVAERRHVSSPAATARSSLLAAPSAF